MSAGVFSVTAEEIERVGKMDNSTVLLPEESGGGYMASLEATHQLHCLVGQSHLRITHHDSHILIRCGA